VLHTYVVYPLWLLIFTQDKQMDSGQFLITDELPEVAILMAAYNEEKVIGDKIKSVLHTTYPLDKIKFYIGSDASTDKTDEIVKAYQKENEAIKLFQFGGRTGKSEIINELSDKATEKLFILTDANVLFREDTIFNLIRHFKNSNKAQVCANIVKVSASNKGIATQEKSYIAIENKVKYKESVRWKVVMGAEGGCYAIRKINFAKVPKNFFMDDFYITMNVIEQKKEIVFDKEAICYEDVPTESLEEFKRKVRISIGNFQNLARYKDLLSVFWEGIGFAFLSHKVFRWITPFLLINCFISSFILMFYDHLFIPFFLIQLFGCMMPVLEWLLNINFGPFRFVSHFYLMNLALLKGFIVYVKGVESNVWQPTKREVN
jgi:cellulose synthase/poly-beta-1,6-N-acetylglucosamine synthase-like glycosyltransferase